MGTCLQGLLSQLGKRQATATSRYLDSRFSLNLLPRLSLRQVPGGIPSSVTDALPPPAPIASPGLPPHHPEALPAALLYLLCLLIFTKPHL